MPDQFPIGTRQKLSLGSLTLELDACDFSPDGSAGIAGFSRSLRSQTEYSYSIFGEAVIKSDFVGPRYSLRWSLQLPTDKYFKLKLLQEQQIEAFANRISPSYILLDDQRLAHTEKIASRKRAKLGNIPNAAPASFLHFWPRMAIGFLPSFTNEFAMQLAESNWLHRIELEATELTLLSPANFDIA